MAAAPVLHLEMTAVPSPCVDVCTMDPVTGLCTGCLRTIDEIAAWGVLNDDQKREVWDLIFERRATVPELASNADGAPEP
jgi:predicted Fe-S protein YdhL (DUF1289 family)